MKQYFEYTDETSNKFWEINLEATQVIISYGRIGVENPHQIIKEFDNEEKARKFAEKKIKEKEKKGYLEKN